jgi:CRISPR-associated endonuclease Cas2
MEQGAKKRRRKENVQQIVLSTVAIAGIIAVAMIAPNIFQAIPRLMGDKYKFGFRARTAAGRLAQKGYVRFVERNGKRFVEITEKGERAYALEQARFATYTNVNKRWDKRWRIVIFDIPETRRALRERVRRLVREFGFLKLQDSVWVFPYDCEELIAMMKTELRIGKDILYIIADSIENDRWVRRQFNLPQDM